MQTSESAQTASKLSRFPYVPLGRLPDERTIRSGLIARRVSFLIEHVGCLYLTDRRLVFAPLRSVVPEAIRIPPRPEPLLLNHAGITSLGRAALGVRFHPFVHPWYVEADDRYWFSAPQGLSLFSDDDSWMADISTTVGVRTGEPRELYT